MRDVFQKKTADHWSINGGEAYVHQGRGNQNRLVVEDQKKRSKPKVYKVDGAAQVPKGGDL